LKLHGIIQRQVHYKFEYLGKFKVKFKADFCYGTGTKVVLIDEKKNRGRKYRAAVPLMSFFKQNIMPLFPCIPPKGEDFKVEKDLVILMIGWR
jgi:hypothetical protein